MAVKKGGRGYLFGRKKGCMNTKLRGVCDSKGSPINFFASVARLVITSGPGAAEQQRSSADAHGRR